MFIIDIVKTFIGGIIGKFFKSEENENCSKIKTKEAQISCFEYKKDKVKSKQKRFYISVGAMIVTLIVIVFLVEEYPMLLNWLDDSVNIIIE